jgi:peptidoglycan/xylan/chitin deacetylase (PgdA/CDA1 family)/folate-dependent phosphoribosylglycinamide formyltransferase PurN
VEQAKLRVAFLVGEDNSPTRQSIEAVCQLAGVQPAAILLDTATVPFKRRLKNLSRNLRSSGWTYLVSRLIGLLRAATENAVRNAVVSQAEVRSVLRQAFPARCSSLEDIGARYGVSVHAAGNLNGPEAVRILRSIGPDLGIVLGTRILKPGTFSIPRLGSINLHKGKVPEYRGMPPGFWELYDGASEAGVTVHFVEKQVDTGDIVAESSIPILRTDTPDTLIQKLHAEGTAVLASAVTMIRDGTTNPRRQEMRSAKPRTRPSIREVEEVRRKLPHWKSRHSDISGILRDLYLLLVYFSGLYWAVRQWHRRSRSRGAIFLYHRVNDYSKDVLTVDTESFAAQLIAISKRYPFASTKDVVDCVRNERPLRATTVAIHFDDCYQEVLTNGAPILKALGIPACAFISSGFVDTERQFAHDLSKYPFSFPNFRSGDIQRWISLGFEVGAHTVNHVNLSESTPDAARSEIVECGRALTEITGRTIDLFSFPFGRLRDINATATTITAEAGYAALFSAFGGFIGSRTDPYDIPRIGCSSEPALYCLLELEGLALGQIASGVRALIAFRTRPRSRTPAAHSASAQSIRLGDR